MNIPRLLTSYFRRWLPGLVLAAGVGVAFAAATNTRPPNLVIIFTDDQGYGDVGVFGAQGFTTPNLDRLATEGTVFRNFHVAQAVCSASRAALLTGCYPNRLGIHGALSPKSVTGISSNEVTLAELVKPLGYATGIFGKWHLGDAPQFLPTRHGFDEYYGLPYSNDMWPLHPDYVSLPPDAAGRKRGFPDLPLLDGERVANPRVTGPDQEQLTTQYTERAVAFIARNRERPFFLYLAHSMPHVPIFVSDKFRGKSARGLYGDVIMEIDWSVGEVLKALRTNGLEENTWVIFTSDNGPWLSYGDHAGSSGPLREGKGTSWEGGTRVPCLMRWPGRIPAGAESQAMLMTIDLLPTFAGRVGAKLPEHPIDGRDVWPLIAGQPGATNPHASYWTYYDNNSLQSVISGDGRWKLVLPHTYRTLAGKPGGRAGRPVAYQQRKLEVAELYDLANNVGETKNVAAAHPETVQRLLAEAEQARTELGDRLTDRKGTGVREPGRLVKD
jgi:arylsulfatase A